MGKMKKLMVLLTVCCLVLGGCGDSGQDREGKVTEDYDGVSDSTQKESDEAGEADEKQDSIDGFENVSGEYDRFNSFASENGLGGTLVYIEGKVISQTKLGEGEVSVLSIVVEQEDGNLISR